MQSLIVVGVFLLALIFASYNVIDWNEVYNKPTKLENKYIIYQDGLLQTQTILTQDQLKIQNETGCIENCHKDFK